MTVPDPDAVQVLAVALHAVECLPGAAPTTRWSDAHHRRDLRKAIVLATRVRDAGYTLITLEEDR